MSMAKQMSAALNRRMGNLQYRTDHLSFADKVRAYLKVVRRNEHRKSDLGAAACDCARRAIMKIYCLPLVPGDLQYVLLTPEERVRCGAEKIDAKKLAFDRLLINLGVPDDWRRG